MIVSNSDRVMFKECRRKWDWGSPNRQNLRIRKKQSPLWLGSLVHLCLEGYYLGKYKTAFKAFLKLGKLIPTEERETFAEEMDLAGNMLRHYSMFHTDLEKEPFTVLAIELGFKIPFGPPGDYFSGTFDGLIRWKDTNKVGLLEHKTFGIAKAPELHDIDDQTAIYPAVANMLIKQGKIEGTTPDDFCDTVFYNGLWKRYPGEIKLLQKGGVSSQCLKGMTKPWFEYSKNSLGLDCDIPVDSFEDMENNVGRYFPTKILHRGPLEQEFAIKRLMNEFAEMNRKDLIIYHNPTNDCKWKCSFLSMCVAENTGADVAAIIQEGYEQSPSRGAAYE